MQTFIHGNRNIISVGFFLIMVSISAVFITKVSKSNVEKKRWLSEYERAQDKLSQENQKLITLVYGDEK